MKSTTTRLYWVGPCDMLIPCNVDSVAWFDCNSLSRSGCVTEMAGLDSDGNLIPPLSDDEYLEKYAILKEDGHYHLKRTEEGEFDYDGNDDNDYYWIGPYGMLIPSTVSSVKAENGIDIHHSDGSITGKKMTREIYLDKYASKNDANVWYYIEEEEVRPNKRPRID